jgi:hypothetical protein
MEQQKSQILYKVYTFIDKRKEQRMMSPILYDTLHEFICTYMQPDVKAVEFAIVMKPKANEKTHDLTLGNVTIDDEDDTNKMFILHFGDETKQFPISDIDFLLSNINDYVETNFKNYTKIVNKYIIKKLSEQNKSSNEKLSKDEEVMEKKVKQYFRVHPENIKNYEKKYKKYIYDKKNVYPKMLNELLSGRKIEDVSLLVRRDVLIMLFMDGRTIEGVEERPTLFNTEDEYETYTLLQNCFNDDFEFPNDMQQQRLVNLFTSFVPEDIEFPSVDDLNNDTNAEQLIKTAMDADVNYKDSGSVFS